MKAYVLTDNGPSIVDIPQPQPTGEQVLVQVRAACLNRADLGMARGRAHGSRGGAGSTLGGEGAGEVVAVGPAGEGRQGRRSRDGLDLRRIRRVRTDGLRARVPHPGQQHELRAGGDAARRAQHHAQRGRHRRRAEARPDRADPGRKLRRRADGDADRQAEGRAARDRHLHRRRPPRAAERIRRRPCAWTRRIRPGSTRC